jgi:hypothetical protein
MKYRATAAAWFSTFFGTHSSALAFHWGRRWHRYRRRLGHARFLLQSTSVAIAKTHSAKYERALIATRTSAALQASKRQGLRCGHIPFGYRLASDGRTLLLDETEQSVLAEMQALRSAGYTPRATGAELNARGYRTRKARGGITSFARCCSIGRRRRCRRRKRHDSDTHDLCSRRRR